MYSYKSGEVVFARSKLPPNISEGSKNLLIEKVFFNNLRFIKNLKPSLSYIPEIEWVTPHRISKMGRKELFLELLKIANTIRGDRFQIALMQSRFLVTQGLPPLLSYSFNKWHAVEDEGDYGAFIDLLELSSHYLYRLFKTEVGPQNYLKEIGEGSYNRIYIDSKEEFLYKIPINYAAFSFVNEEEFRISKLLSRSTISGFISSDTTFNQATKVIKKRYIKGKTGELLLNTDGTMFEGSKLTGIKDFFSKYKELSARSGTILDIHPGNFIWNDETEKWYFIDLGPVPNIGAGYFPLESFEIYFKKIWLDRKHLMLTEPIRSVLL